MIQQKIDPSLQGGNNFSLLRLLCAMSVFSGHSYYIWGLNVMENPFRLEHIGFGRLGVFLFFAMSGFLVYRSWQRNPDLKTFFLKRFKRMLPPLWVSLFFCAFILGPWATSLSFWEYYTHPKLWRFFGLGFCRLFGGSDFLPGVFTPCPIRLVNGSLWTMTYEMILCILLGFLCYIGFVSKATRTVCVLVFSWIFLALWFFKGNFFPDAWSHKKIWMSLNLGCFFWMGVLYGWLEENYINFFKNFLSLEGVVLGILIWHLSSCNPCFYQTVAFLFLPYLAISFGLAPSILRRCSLEFFEKNNFSYGIYLYGFPIQQTVCFMNIKYDMGLSFYIYNIVSITLTVLFALFSWFYIEKPILKRGYVFPKGFFLGSRKV